MDFAAKVLHRFAATHAIVGGTHKVAGLFAPFVAHARDRSRVNGCGLFKQQGIQHDLHTHPDGQDHRPEVTLSPMVATAFIASGKERLQTGLMESEEVILSGFSDQFLIAGDGDQLTVRKTGAGPGRFKAC